MIQFESITTAMENANIPYTIKEFMDGSAFNLLVDDDDFDLATQVAMQAENEWKKHTFFNDYEIGCGLNSL